MGGFSSIIDKASVKIGEAMERSPIKTAIVNKLDNFAPKILSRYPDLGPSLSRGLRLAHFNMDTEFVKNEAGKDIRTGLQEVEHKAQLYNQKFAEAAMAGKPITIPHPTGPKVLDNPHEMYAHAMKTARADVWGPRDQHLQTLLHVATKQGGDSHAQMLSNHVMVSLHDGAPEGTGMSSIANNFRMNNKVKGANPSFTPKDVNPYQRKNDFERAISKYSNTIFAGKAAAPHSTNFMVSTLNNSIKSSMKGMLATLPVNHNYENSKLFLKMMDAMPETAITEYRQQWEYNHSLTKGIVSKFNFIPNSVGEMIHRNLSMPGLNAVRRITLVNAGMTAKYELDELGTSLLHAKDPTLIEAKLRRMGINPDKIRKQNGFMKPEDYKTGIFKNVDQSIGLVGNLQRTNLSQSTMMGRMMFQFHSSITRITKSIYDGYMFDFKNKDYAGLARRTAILSLAFPEFGNAVSGIESLWGGHGAEKSWEDYKEREGKMWGSHGALSLISSRIYAMSHMGATGISINYSRSLGRNQLAKQMAGPLASSAFEMAQDANTAIHADSEHPKKGAQLERDLIRASIPAWFSGIAAHSLISTQAEENAKKVKSARSIRSSARRKAMKQLHPSSNPLNNIEAEMGEN